MYAAVVPRNLSNSGNIHTHVTTDGHSSELLNRRGVNSGNLHSFKPVGGAVAASLAVGTPKPFMSGHGINGQIKGGEKHHGGKTVKGAGRAGYKRRRRGVKSKKHAEENTGLIDGKVKYVEGQQCKKVAVKVNKTCYRKMKRRGGRGHCGVKQECRHVAVTNNGICYKNVPVMTEEICENARKCHKEQISKTCKKMIPEVYECTKKQTVKKCQFEGVTKPSTCYQDVPFSESYDCSEARMERKCQNVKKAVEQTCYKDVTSTEQYKCQHTDQQCYNKLIDEHTTCYRPSSNKQAYDCSVTEYRTQCKLHSTHNNNHNHSTRSTSPIKSGSLHQHLSGMESHKHAGVGSSHHNRHHNRHHGNGVGHVHHHGSPSSGSMRLKDFGKVLDSVKGVEVSHVLSSGKGKGGRKSVPAARKRGAAAKRRAAAAAAKAAAAAPQYGRK
eukprot:GHVQ01014751.1.p1 GENE.GHVQ01014751.1~~GHVQ01014751.1.p1  ORF type:complete len:505 (+),score=104.91 GHVQ01014751.1:194-1516(+)